jgi:hypothetical protein
MENFFAKIKIGGATVKRMAVTTRAGVRADDGDNMKIGSLVVSSTDGRAYLKIADNNADADWQKITVSNAD